MLNTKPIKKLESTKSDILNVDEKILDNIAIKTDKLDNNINHFKIDNVLNNEKEVEKAVEKTVERIPIAIPQYIPATQVPPQISNFASAPQAPNTNQIPLSTMTSYTVNYDDEKNSYIITYNNSIESIFTHKDILDALMESNNTNYVIRQYFFIVSHNQETGVNEINFVNSPVTCNIEIMIKIQNYFYELLNSSTDNALVFDKLLFLYYQLIIYLFRNYPRYENYAKIQKFYSTLSFRFSSLVLKQLVELQKVNTEMELKIQQIESTKDELIAHISGISLSTNKTQNTNATTDKTQYTSDASVTTNKTLSELLSVNTSDGLSSFTDNEQSIIKSAPSDGLTSFTDNDADKNEFTSSNQLINKHGITNSNGLSITNPDEIWNDDASKPISEIPQIQKGGDDSQTSSDEEDSDEDETSENDEESFTNSNPSYNEFSAKNNAKKYHLNL